MYNIYCDESCHLENDNQKSMVLGGIWCPSNKIKSISKDINLIKEKHGLSKFSELKWTKISPSKLRMYEDIVNYFFENDDLHFRCLIIPNKSDLNHEKFNQSHDDWYYKMYYNMLVPILIPTEEYNIYLDIKDTRSSHKVKDLQAYLGNTLHDFDLNKIKKVQNIRSHESQLMQLTDILIGSVAYNSRDLESSPAKLSIMGHIKSKSGYTWTKNTLYREDKFNMFFWNAQKG
ncbi:MAG: DUF3800 domain-containing protein [Peptostreptococcaceae bacterium]